MNIEKLVADRELCEQIPADDFLDAAFCWHYTEVAGFVCGNGCKQFSGKQWQLERSTSGKIVRYRQRGWLIFPAPTLQEILLDLPNWSDLTVDFVNPQISVRIKGKDVKLNPSPAAEALKIWLALKEAK